MNLDNETSQPTTVDADRPTDRSDNVQLYLIWRREENKKHETTKAEKRKEDILSCKARVTRSSRLTWRVSARFHTHIYCPYARRATLSFTLSGMILNWIRREHDVLDSRPQPFLKTSIELPLLPLNLFRARTNRVRSTEQNWKQSFNTNLEAHTNSSGHSANTHNNDDSELTCEWTQMNDKREIIVTPKKRETSNLIHCMSLSSIEQHMVVFTRSHLR